MPEYAFLDKNSDDGRNLPVSNYQSPITFLAATPVVTPCSLRNPPQINFSEPSCTPQFLDTTPIPFGVDTPTGTPYNLGNTPCEFPLREMNTLGVDGEEEAVGCTFTNADYDEMRELFDDSYDENFELLGFASNGTAVVNECTVASSNNSFETTLGISDSSSKMLSDSEESDTFSVKNSFVAVDESTATSANYVLKKLRIKNTKRVIIGTLNINSVASKIEHLREVIGNYLDIFTIQETKLDDSFPTAQLLIEGYSEPYRLDRNRHGGGVLIYVREDIPSKPLTMHNFTKHIEGLFIEVNLRKTKILVFGGYRSDHKTYGLCQVDFFEQIGLALDVYSNYDKFLLAGDFNTEEEVETLQDFLLEHNARNLVKEKTCFKSVDNPSCIDLFLTNSHQSFQNTTAVTTGLSDFS